jgi:hypothetical protein
MSTSRHQVYAMWRQRLQQLWPQQRKNRLDNWAQVLMGLYLSGSVHLSRIATKLPTRPARVAPATLPSVTRRLQRLLDNPALRVRRCYEPLLRHWLEQVAAHQQEVRLIVDGSKVGSAHQLLAVALAYRQRAIPLAWTWVRHRRGHSSSYKQRALLGYVRRLLQQCAPDAHVLLVGDAEFGSIELLRQLEAWRWRYVVRQKRRNLVWLPPVTAAQGTAAQATAQGTAAGQWQRLGECIQRAGESHWLEQVPLTQLHAHCTNVLLHWQSGEAEPWLLATNLDTAQETLHAYRLRMWIEEMFGDLKGHGFDLESTRLWHVRRLSRLTLAVMLLYVWLLCSGAQVIRRGQRRLVDRADRRDLSVFRIGWYMVDWCLAAGRALPCCLHLLLRPKLSGS